MNDGGRIRVLSMFCPWESGGTLLAILLNNHPRLVCNGETFPFGHEPEIRYGCSCGAALIECPFYRDAGSGMRDPRTGHWDRDLFRLLPRLDRSRWRNVVLNSYRHRLPLRDRVIRSLPPYAERLRRFVDAHLDFMRRAMRIECADLYVDGTKNLRRAELLAGCAAVALQAVHFVRDGRGVCYSRLKALKGDTAPRDGDLREFAAEWQGYLALVDLFARRHPQVPLLTIRYEDLCADPAATLARICGFLGMDYDPGMPGPARRPFHVLGNTMRKSAFTGEIREDLRWVEGFSRSQTARLGTLMARELSRFGYV
jgi:hypothetical protein